MPKTELPKWCWDAADRIIALNAISDHRPADGPEDGLACHIAESIYGEWRDFVLSIRPPEIPGDWTTMPIVRTCRPIALAAPRRRLTERNETMKELATFTQTNGLKYSIDPDTVTSVEGLEPNKEHKIRTVIHGKDGSLVVTVTISHDAVLETLKAVDIKNAPPKLLPVPTCSYCDKKGYGVAATFEVEEPRQSPSDSNRRWTQVVPACVLCARDKLASGRVVKVHPAAKDFASLDNLRPTANATG